MTVEQQRARDDETRAAYRAHARIVAGVDQAAVDRQLAIDAGTRAKGGQVCWLCEQRRACISIGGRWECRDCRSVR